MDIQPQSTQPISDDQELAKVLAGVSEQADESAAAGTGTTPATGLPPLPTPPAVPAAPAPAPATSPAKPGAEISATELAEASKAEASHAAKSSDSALDGIKKEALGELRPLVDKLNVSAEEKFDTYLLLIRSTDDKTLIAPAHEAAKAIEDEAKRADALLNIIKEIDYLSNPHQ